MNSLIRVATPLAITVGICFTMKRLQKSRAKQDKKDDEYEELIFNLPLRYQTGAYHEFYRIPVKRGLSASQQQDAIETFQRENRLEE